MNKEISAPFEVIENQLLTALDDKSKVAILATQDDLDLLISALTYSPNKSNASRTKMLDGLKQLRDAAFKKPGDKNKDKKTKNIWDNMRVEGDYEITPMNCDNCGKQFEYKHHKSRPHGRPPYTCSYTCHSEYINKHPSSRFA